MKLTSLRNSRRHVLALALALLFALSATYAPVVLDSMASTALTPAALACTVPGGGC